MQGAQVVIEQVALQAAAPVGAIQLSETVAAVPPEQLATGTAAPETAAPVIATAIVELHQPHSRSFHLFVRA
eukprot:509039-Amphidinium_carterae.1